MGRLLQIGFIWFGCAVAWMVLGGTLIARSGETSGALLEEVHALWGPPLLLRPPSGGYVVMQVKKERTTIRDAATGKETQTEVSHDEPVNLEIPLVGSDLHARLRLTQRQKGLLWFPTYDVQLSGRYRYLNDSGSQRRIDFTLPLPGAYAIVDGLTVLDEDARALPITVHEHDVGWSVMVAQGASRTFFVTLSSRGTSTFTYGLTAGSGEARDFRLVVDTDFADVDFPAGSLSPTQHAAVVGGWRGEWKFDRLIANSTVAIDLPQRVNPGPLASRITFFAPIGLLFFFFVVAVRAAAARRSLHPLNYFFFGCAFFAFHLLFSYTVDHLAIAPALAIASLTSIFLVVSYARLFVGWRFAVLDMAVAQLLYLVLFSTTFLWKGYTGLAITIGAVVTLFVMMQFTGRRPTSEVLVEGKASA